MGTRGLLGFIILGQRYAAYNHWDSYPEGLGQDIINFILSLTPEDYATMADLVADITWVDSESTPSPELQEHYQKLGFTDLRVSLQTPEDWYCLLRKTQGAAALPAIRSGELKHMVDSPFEGGDWVWAYYIDFEHRTLETWENGSETALDISSFESLIKGGVKEYLARVTVGEEE